MITINPHNWAEIAAAITCFICLLAKPSAVNRWFCWFLWLTVLVEFTGKWAGANMAVKAPLYSIHACIEYLFYAILFTKITPVSSRKKEIRFFSLLFLLFFLLNVTAIQKIETPNTYTFTLEGIILTFFCLTWYYDIVNADVQNKHKWSRMLLVGAILIYFVSTLGIFASFNAFAQKMPGELYKLYSLTVRNIIVVTYGIYSIALILELIEGRRKNDNITIPISNQPAS
jgi:hypothetical protein